jgi:hypothetical protein
MKSLGRIAAVAAAAGAGVVIPLVGLGSPAGAAGGSAISTGVPSASEAAAPAVTLPNTYIRGTTAHWVPTTLTATERWNGTAACKASDASFTIKNRETATEDVTFTLEGTDEGVYDLPTGKTFLCVNTDVGPAKLTAALPDHKKLTVTL